MLHPHPIYPAEYVLPGHPDKLCDGIADALVQDASRRQKRAAVGVEVAVHRNHVFVTGRLACRDAEAIDVEGIVRGVFRSAGYDEPWYPSPPQLEIHADLYLGELLDGEAEFRSLADDQSVVTGYAVDLPGTNYLPPEHWLAWRLSLRLARLRIEHPQLELGPDGKVFVLYENSGGASRLTALSASLQQQLAGNQIDLRREVLAVLEHELQIAAGAIPGFNPSVPDDVTVNGAGNFAVGGPDGDNGLSGKKLVVDAYGPRVPIGGGALSGKDLFRADRAGAIMARRIAKAVVLTGTAAACTAAVAFIPGADRARLVSLRGNDGQPLDVSRWERLSDLSLAGVGERYTGREDLIDVARSGHFTGRDRAWEQVTLDPPGVETSDTPRFEPETEIAHSH